MTDTSGVDPQSIIAQAKARAQAAGSTAAPKGDRLVPSQTDPLAALKAHTQPGPSLIDRANSAMGTPFDAQSLKNSNPWADILHGLGRAMTLAPMALGPKQGGGADSITPMDNFAPLNQGALRQGQQAVEGALASQGGAPPPDVQQALDALGNNPASQFRNIKGPADWKSEITPADRAEADNLLQREAAARGQADPQAGQADQVGQQAVARAVQAPGWVRPAAPGTPAIEPTMRPPNAPQSSAGLRVARQVPGQPGTSTPNGYLKIGQPGQIHADLIDPLTRSTSPDEMGFVTPDGKFLTREEAYKYVTQQNPNAAARLNPPRPTMRGEDELVAEQYNKLRASQQPPAPAQAQVPPMPQGQPPPAQPALPPPGQGAPAAPAGGGVPPGVLMAIELALHGHPAMAGAAWMLRRYAARNPGVVPQIAARLGGTPARLAGLKRLLGF